MSRQHKISRSVTNAVVIPEDEAVRRSVGRIINAFLTVYAIHLHQHAPDLFGRLRGQWNIDTESYLSSFSPDENNRQSSLQSKGDMGYSGSTFFSTSDARYLVKSIPRHFEHSFFKDDLLGPYVDYMSNNFSSLLIRITDFLAVDDVYKVSPGVLLGLAPSHHIVMENLLIGKEEGERRAKEEFSEHDAKHQGPQHEDEEPWKWETWDLKPTTYFFPERDIAQGKLAPESTKDALADELGGKLVLTQPQAEAFMDQVKRDTELLASTNSVDYSLFLVRIPVPPSQQTPIADTENHENPFSDNVADPEHNSSTSAESQRPPDTVPVPANPPFTPPYPPSWRTGIKSADGKYVYRAAVLDFFWAKHKTHAKIMTHLVDLWNGIDLGGDNGPMSITTSSDEYRERFIEMCEDYIKTRRSGKEDDDE
ncbi:hypothetical protein LTR70_008861 [Exophiala xenobiotica]|uniref:PIPK domain-containing protein n=1 Tax=Lithohypha guttulata TaxID=1690604 RepID=A0ABR0JZN6_9EURO|nr:hypothetical protein LTR24_008523 [Lithohypha guttulata]KAK5311325.1 hypothetical protein LTR70_008861 [Exophiala xenobiotica]